MGNDQSRSKEKTGQRNAVTGGVLSRFLALEQRVLLDAAAVETAEQVAEASAVQTADSADHATFADLFQGGGLVASPLASGGGAREILFVDSGIENYDALIRNLGPGVEVHVLQGSDWASQVQAVLGRRDGDVSAIHLVSHGHAGSLVLGGETVDQASLDSYSRVWSSMRQALTADGDILVYGCDVAAGDVGNAFIGALAQRTGADIAASSDLSGVATLGGDWDLEETTGDVAASSLYGDGAADDFLGLLADGWVEDAEITAGTTAVAITRTTDGKDWKFIGTSGSNKVDIYVRHATNGTWGNGTTAGTPFATITKSGQFGFDVAAAGNKFAVGAPTFDGAATNDGQVYVYSYNGTNWTTENIVAHRTATGSGQSNYQANVENDSGNDQFGYSVDLAWDGGTNYRLIVGNPNEDWWQTNYGTDGWGAASISTSNGRYEAGVAHVYTAAGHVTAFTFATQIESQQGGTTGNGHYFGGVVAAGYDYDNAKWWFAVGGDGLNAVRTYGAPAAGTIGGGTFTQALAWDSAGNNDVSMDDDYMVIANAGSVQGYKLDAASTAFAVKGGTFGGAGSVVMIDDWDQSAAGDATDGARLIFSYGGYTGIADINSGTGGNFVAWYQINTRQEVAVAIDRTLSMDMLTANSSGAKSYHYNWAPNDTTITVTLVAGNDLTYSGDDWFKVGQYVIDSLGAAHRITAVNTATNVVTTATTGTFAAGSFTVRTEDVFTINEDTSTLMNVVANEFDTNIFYYGTLFGDSLVVSAVGPASIFGAGVSFAGGNITYNPTVSSDLQSLAVGESATESFVVTIADGQNGFKDTALTVNITGVNDAPVVTGTPIVPFKIQQSGGTVVYDVSAFFTDVDNNEDSSLVVEKVLGGTGDAWITTSGQSLIVNVAAGTAAGDYTVIARAKDVNGTYSGNQTFTIRVDSTNNAPVLQTALVDQVALADSAFNFTVPSSTFRDPDPSPYDTITYSATLVGGGALPAWLTFNTSSGSFSGSPTAANVGTYDIRVTANDNAPAHRGGALTAFDDFRITVVNPTLHTATQFADGPAASADLGFSTAISEDGNWLIVGSPGANSGRGSVYYYKWGGASWGAGTLLQASDGVAGDNFGWSVGIDNTGTKIVVGARGDDGGMGSAYVFTRSGDLYGTQAKLTAATRTANDRFGTSVAINEGGGYVLIGASHYDYAGLTDSGAAFMAASVASTTLAPNVVAEDPEAYARFGTDVSFDQNLLVVSAIADDNPSGIVGRWLFDDGAGSIATASFGGPNGNLYDSQFLDDDTRGVVLQSVGANGGVLLDSAVDLGASWSISSWVKGVSATAGWRTLTRGSADHQVILNAAGELGVYDNAGGTGFNGSGYVINPATFTGWHNIVAVGEGARTKFYVDGVYVGDAAKKPTDDVIAINNYQGGGQRFADFVDDFRIYDRAMTETEIRANYLGMAPPGNSYADAGAVYVFSTDMSNQQVAKLYMPDSSLSDYFGWAVDVDVYDTGGTRQSGIIVASSIYNDKAASDGGAVYVWRSSSLQSGALHNDDLDNGIANDLGNGTWQLEAQLTAFDVTPGDYFGNDVAVDYDESTGGTRLVVGAPFDDDAGTYAGAVYAFKHQTGSWLPEKFVDTSPQGGSPTTAAFFGSAVDVADFRAVFGSRWRDTGGQTNDGAVYSVNLSTQGSYAGALSVETSALESSFLPATEMDVVALDTSGTQGQVSFDADGRMVYTPGSAFKSLGINQVATDTFVYLTEQNGTTYTNTVTVTIHGVDERVDVVSDDAQVSAAETTLLNVLANDVYADADGSALVIQSLDTGSLQGRLLNSAAGLVYDPNGKFDALRAGEVVLETFSYTVTNATGIESTGYVTLTVVGQDDPVVAVEDSVSVRAGAAVTVDVLGNDSDKDGADTFTVVAVDESAARGSVSVNNDGTLTYVAGDAFASLKAGETATDRIVYTVRDETGNESSALLTVTVFGANDAPVAADDQVDVDAGVTALLDVTANDRDPDGEPVRVTRIITTATAGQVTLNADGTVTYAAPATLATDSFSYEVVDALGETSTATVFVNLKAPAGEGGGSVPVAGNDVAVTSGTNPVVIPVGDNDGGAVLVGTSVSGTTGSVGVGSDGSLVYTPGESLALLPAGRVFVDTFTYTVQFADGRLSTASVRIYVNGIYVAPVVGDDSEVDTVVDVTGYIPVVATAGPVTGPDSASGTFAAADNVAAMALDALVEMAAEAEQVQPAPAEAVSASVVPVENGKPGLSAVLGKEVQSRRAGMDALLRHFAAADRKSA